MSHSIKIKKGLDIPLGGDAERIVVDMRGIERYAVKPPDVVGFTPRLLVSEGDTVSAGQPLVADKRDPRLTLPAPVSGTVAAIVRGDKRRLMEVVINSEASIASGNTGNSVLSPESPCWWMLRERPFGTIANPNHTPKGIFVSMLAGVSLEKLALLLGADKAKFYRKIVPGDTLAISAELVSERKEKAIGTCRCEIHVDRELMAAVEITIAVR